MGKLCVMAIACLVSAQAVAACDLADEVPRLAKPLDRPAGTGFGLQPHPILGVARPHDGIDFQAPMGTEIRAAASGVVTLAARSGEFGNLIVLRHNAALATHYAHLARFAVAAGDCVTQGQVIGLVGNTGLSAGPHLHFEVHTPNGPIDPAPLIDVRPGN